MSIQTSLGSVTAFADQRGGRGGFGFGPRLVGLRGTSSLPEMSAAIRSMIRLFIDTFGLPPYRHQRSNRSRRGSGSKTLIRTVGSFGCSITSTS